VKKDSLSHKNFLLKDYYKNTQIKKAFDKIFNEINDRCDDTKNTYHVLSKKFNFDFKINYLKKYKKFKNIVIVGMGGSVLGSNAIYDFLKHKIKKKVTFFDNLDKEKLSRFKKNNNVSNCLFIIISKSGNTIETLSNLKGFNILKLNAKNIIIITEKRKNILNTIAKKYNLFFIEHKNFLGGRYSVLSEVGIIPSFLMGINIIKLRSNLKKYLKDKNKLFLKKSSLALSEIINKKKYRNLIFLNYSPKLEKFLFWCQQLIAESLGKKGKGFLPTVSNAPKDHHSLLQLYLEGPKDKIFYIFSEKETTRNKLKAKKINKQEFFFDNKNIDQIKIAQKNAFIKALLKNKIPFREFKINSVDEQTLGELFSYFILETSIVGKLSKINPFDQPAVEQVKIFTKKLLS
jgi:glucose-6-phosphate isomerase